MKSLREDFMKHTGLRKRDPMKYIIDMDIGDDIDDAIALYAAMRRGLDIIGVTTVFHNTQERARQAKRLLKEYGNGYESVPVFAGYGAPLGTEDQTWGHIPHYSSELESNLYDPDGSAPEEAVDFIIRSCHQYGKGLTVIAIGAFTNLARVIEKDAKALNLASRVAIMGGAYYKQYADWNVTCDVDAADTIFRKLDNLVCIGADVTHLTVGEDKLYHNLLNYQGQDKGHLYLTELCHLWKKDRPTAKLLLHDPLVIYYLTNPEVCGMKPASVAVITEGFAKGMTLNVDAYGKMRFHPDVYRNFDMNHKASVAATVNCELLNRLIFDDFNV